MSSSIFTAFHPDGSALALSAGDGRIKVWDVTTGNLRNEMADLAAAKSETVGHLDMDYTCLAWGGLAPKKKKKKDKGAPAFVVVGTGSGDIIAWDTSLGELKWRTSDCHSGSVKSVSFGENGQRLFSVGDDGHCCEIDSASGQVLSKFKAAKTPLSCVAVAQDGGSVAVASAEVKLFDLSSKKRLRKFPGHPAPARALCFTPDGKHVLSAATGECHVVLWHLEKADSAAPVTMSVEHPVVAIGVTGFRKIDDVKRVVAVTESGVAYVWTASTVEDLGSAQPTVFRVEATTAKGNQPGVLAARLLHNEVLVAHGTSAKPHFEKVSLIDQSGVTIVLKAVTGGALLPAGPAADTKKNASLENVVVLGADNAGEATLPRAQIELKKKTKKRRAEDDEQAPKPAEKQQPSAAEPSSTALTIVPADDGPTMEERLVALKIIEDASLEEAIVPVDKNASRPRADSLAVLLSQALQAEDNALLNKVFDTHDEKLIYNTVLKIKPVEAAKFLAVGVSKLEIKPSNALRVLPWIRAVLLQHASFIMTNHNMQPVLTSLYQLIESRLAVFRPLVSLSGRLDLIMAQIQKNERKVEEVQVEEVVYEEQDDEPEVIDVIGDGAAQYIEGDDEETSDEEEDDDDDDIDMGDEEAMDEDEPDIKLNGNGNGISDGDDDED